MQILQHQVLTSEDISLANPTVFECKEMAFGNVVDMGEVQAGIDIRGDFATSRVQKHAAGRCWPDVMGADRRRRIYDNGR